MKHDHLPSSVARAFIALAAVLSQSSTSLFAQASAALLPTALTPTLQSVGGERLDPARFGPSRIEPIAPSAQAESASAEIIADATIEAIPHPIGVAPIAPSTAPPSVPLTGGSATPPVVGASFPGQFLFDSGITAIPPDCAGAAGLVYFVGVVNRNISVFSKTTGTRLVNTSLASFFGATLGDPRVVYDHVSDRWFITTSDFNTRIYLAVSLTGDPTGSWFKTSFVVSTGTDAGRFPDYPTLGFDANGLYIAALMGNGFPDTCSIFALDKAPLVAAVPSLGTITAFRQLANDFAVQPCVTFGSPPGEYLISRASSTQLRLRRMNPPLTAPTLTELGFVIVPSHSAPGTAPALGSTTPLDLFDARLMNAEFRNGSVWTVQHILVGSLSGCRWYQVDPLALSTPQVGTISDPSRAYFYPSIAVNARNDVVLGFSGSSTSEFAGAYFTGRLSADAAGQTAAPILLEAGVSVYNRLDASNRNRWGDYSSTVVDPADDRGFWTFQEYAGPTNTWATRFASLRDDPAGEPFCAGDGIDPGVSTACPCNNFGVALHGCRSSVNSAGALLQLMGMVANDDVVLLGSLMPANVAAIYLKGDAEVAGGVTFGDGVRCAGGFLIRLRTVINSGGASQFPGAGDPTLSVRGQTPVGSGLTAYYQTYYRNSAAAFCPPETFNVTNGLRVNW